MACRIGITTDLAEREAYWRRQHPGLRNWTVYRRNLTQSDAQAEENRLRQQWGCDGAPGGPSRLGPVWSVYGFDY